MRKCENLSLVSLCYAIHMSWFLCSACYFILEQKIKWEEKTMKCRDLCLLSVNVLYSLDPHQAYVGYCKEKWIALNSAHQTTSVLL